MLQSPSETDQRLASIPNPFSDAAVGSVWDPRPVDVPQIHANVSAELLHLVDERSLGRHHRCVLLYGDAGSGKTHVMRRLRIALENSGGPPVAFSWVRMQTSPSMMWRHVRRSLAGDLSRRPFRGSTQLAHLLENRKQSIETVENRDLALVLDHLGSGLYTRDARAWLAGDALPDEALQTLKLGLRDGGEETSEDESRRVLVALSQFLAPSPVVLCLDQLEALQSHPGDRNGLFAIGKLLAALHDEAPNIVVIGCVQTGLIHELASVLSKAETDRYQPTALRPLNAAQIRALVKARLESVPELERLRPAGAAELWPVDIAKLDALAMSREGITPRKVIFECEQMLRAAQDIPEPNATLQDHIQERFDQEIRAAAARLSSGASTSILSDALPRLLHVRGVKTERTGLPPWIDHVLIGPDGRKTAVILANESPRSLWRKLDKICLGWDPAERGAAIIRDAANPLRATAAASIDRLQELERRGARVITPSREALIALDAARRVLANLDSGDLTWRGEKAPVTTVEDWIRKHLPESAAKLLDELTGPVADPGGAGLRLGLAAYLDGKKLAAVADAAAHLQCTTTELENCARQNTDQFGLFGGPQPAVFERIPAVPGA